MNGNDVILTLLIAGAAVLYSSVGHAGASGYLAAMALMGVAPAVMKPTALALNILVAMIAFTKFYRAGAFSWSLLWPFIVASIPFAWLGGWIMLPSHYYKPLVGVVLIYTAWYSFQSAQRTEPAEVSMPTIRLRLFIGGLLGFLSGLTGVGGGIFLSPLLLIMGWAPVRVISGVSAAFILVNSISGLVGVMQTAVTLPAALPWWAVAAIGGGIVGAEYGSRRLGNPTIKKILALVLAIGLVVDDAIVVLENIYRHIEQGMPRMQAALQGSKEIGFAVVAMTLTLAAVYAPVAFMTGRIGKLFIEFALTLAGAVLVSGFVALTLSPMMCSVLLKHEEKHGKVFMLIEGFLNAINSGYKRALTVTLRYRWVIVLAFIGVALSCVALLKTLKSELAPVEDRGIVLGVFLGPDGATLDYTDKYARQIEGIYSQIPEIERYFVVSGSPTVNQGISFVGLTDWSERARRSPDIAKELFPKFMGVPGVMAFPVTPPSLGQSPRERPINFVIVTSATYDELQKVTSQLMAELSKNPGLSNLDNDLKLSKPELSVKVNRDKAADLGVQVDTIGRTLETFLGGRQVTRFKRDGEQYDVIVQVANVDRSNPSDINGIYARGRDGSMISLDNLVSVKETIAPRELNHFGQRRAVTITANLAPGYTMGEALSSMDAVAAQILKPGYAVDYNGQSREFRQSSSSLAVTFVLALAFIYLVLAAQFESFRDPFIIMLTVPLSMAGALLALWLAGGTLNVYSQIGLVTLVGLITKHGILIVEFANQLQEQGMTIKEAVIESATLRLRPILMTTGAMVLGTVPLAMATGAGAESRQQIGWVIVGGLLLGTFFTLFVVPTVYSLLAARKEPEKIEALAS
jgi:multidrug efflux pump